jgi:galactokinase/mevalonate kinase-like predicted kinase
LVHGFSRETAASTRWRALAATKMQEIDELIARATTMKALLQRISTNCTCDTLIECGRGLGAQP